MAKNFARSARAARGFRGAIGEPVRLALDPDRLHLFDPTTEKRLGQAP